jgi:hypothetical protein
MAEQKKADTAVTGNPKKIDVVSQDRNWVLRVNG